MERRNRRSLSVPMALREPVAAFANRRKITARAKDVGKDNLSDDSKNPPNQMQPRSFMGTVGYMFGVVSNNENSLQIQP